MRIVAQRVRDCSVSIDGQTKGHISHGILVLVGIEESDTEDDAVWIAGKITKLRIFDDQNGVMNLDVKAIGGDIMVVSQFTLFASTKKGNRPSYIRSAKEQISRPLYEYFVERVNEIMGHNVPTGEFGANMQLKFTNDGPVTICIDSHNKE